MNIRTKKKKQPCIPAVILAAALLLGGCSANDKAQAKEGGDGLNMFMDNELTIDEGMTDYEILMTYLTDELNGAVGNEYALPQGRIEIR